MLFLEKYLFCFLLAVSLMLLLPFYNSPQSFAANMRVQVSPRPPLGGGGLAPSAASASVALPNAQQQPQQPQQQQPAQASPQQPVSAPPQPQQPTASSQPLGSSSAPSVPLVSKKSQESSSPKPLKPKTFIQQPSPLASAPSEIVPSQPSSMPTMPLAQSSSTPSRASSFLKKALNFLFFKPETLPSLSAPPLSAPSSQTALPVTIAPQLPASPVSGPSAARNQKTVVKQPINTAVTRIAKAVGKRVEATTMTTVRAITSSIQVLGNFFQTLFGFGGHRNINP